MASIVMHVGISLSPSYDPSLWCRVDMSRKHIESCQLRDVLLRGTIVLKMYQTTVSQTLHPTSGISGTMLQVHGHFIHSLNRNTWSVLVASAGDPCVIELFQVDETSVSRLDHGDYSIGQPIEFDQCLPFVAEDQPGNTRRECVDFRVSRSTRRSSTDFVIIRQTTSIES